MSGQGALGEDDLIARYFRPLATAAGAARLLDDAASLTPPEGSDIVLTCDTVTAGVHFFEDDPPEAIAQKALRVNLSDLAAKGAVAEGYLLSLALPDGWTADWMKAFAGGLAADQKTYGVSLYGGDTTRTSGPLSVTVTAFGFVPEGTIVRRTGAKAGHAIYVSGTIGDAALGLQLRKASSLAADWKLEKAERGHLLRRYLLPQPRLALASAVLEYSSASMDISDGLLGDLWRLCEASGVGAAIAVENVPLSSGAAKALHTDIEAMRHVLTGGDDYEILAIVAHENKSAYEAAARKTDSPVTCIGEIVGGFPGRIRVTHDGHVLNIPPDMYRHF